MPGAPGPYEPTQAASAPIPPPAGPGSEPGAAPASAPPDPGSGRLLGGRYRLGARLGHGGMGTVWRAHDEVVDRDVAVKEPRVPDHLSEHDRQTMYQRMRREARTAARIDHPSVVTIHDVVVEEDQPWIVMELVQGRSLADVLGEGTMEPREAARIGLAVAGALDAAHEKGVLHRDVKPDNVLLGRYGRVVLTDFGIAQVEGEQGLTETGSFVGSPEFIAPERVLGQRPGPESDLWSLGVVLYTAIEGVSPFRRSNTPATLQAVLSSAQQPPSRAQGALRTLLIQLLQKQAGDRPGAAEVRQVLEEASRPVPAPRTTALATGPVGGGNAVTRVTRSYVGNVRTKRRWQFGTGGVVVALAAAVAAVVFLTADKAPEGWTTRDEDKRVKAELAVPDDYTRSADESSVNWTDPGGVFTIDVARETKDVKRNSLSDANSYKNHYDEGAQIDYEATMEEVKCAVKEVTHQGEDAAQVTTTFDVPEDEMEEEKAKPRQHRKELILVTDDDVRYRVTVNMPAKGSNRSEGDRIYREVVKSLKIHGL
ncbi:serine/threonine-protein kinase [Streptomyces sp. AJS327]|uniref:serine/threonine-protein kinase n=1 Tax=Streptomyces sp. AJS327 TaxID=2545265 RepID=UPI002155E4EC|nr:serine/threonine-protein kinase [Streptomyces sp. AJS327]